ncbi:hypothetical protein [Nonomuraea salmonea]|uniref:hypothetical protein n=1 Tax=Nonomuraea salmonea TaxID=46181 RepID=UPI002FED1994
MAAPEVLDRIPLLSGVPRSVEELPGGLTNHNYKVTTPRGAYVVRVQASDGALLAIDRDAEHANSLAAAAAGVEGAGARLSARPGRPGGGVRPRAHVHRGRPARPGQPAPRGRGVPTAARGPAVRP